MKSFTAEDKCNASKLYAVLTRHLMDWMGSIQGIQKIDRVSLMAILNISEAELDSGIALIKEFSSVKDIPSITAIIARGEKDPVLTTHDVLRYSDSYRDEAPTHPSDMKDLPVFIDPATQDWHVTLEPTEGSRVQIKSGSMVHVLYGDRRRTDLMDLPGYYSMFL